MNIVITGASKGLGKAISEKFAADKQGHSFFLCARNAETLKAFATELQARFPRTTVNFYACDMGVKAEAEAFANWVLGFNKPVDILVNNAGQFVPGSISNEPEGVLEQMIQVNLYSAYYLTRVLLPHMIQARQGHIFNMCSIASLKAYDNGGAYSISKYALAGFSRNLREELKPHQVKVTAVYPGAAYTDSWSGSGVDPQRLMDAGDIAEMVYATAHLSPRACVEDIILRPQLGDL
ncbi:SDR family oxidoreductase [Deminuibacter soli]|uniref:SDR family NAD(P)-dependent oxidoreductase n=1 Tax=Deminuibacter soli TaxID=2291815 RepID=A0A3E1NRW1_9BACT|nr:SDR family oxidoreductase [Deminuibacter soli]RFM30498.1 SDR family NAD(P)-dependent oxidoreductase [Deminuibacter soli]